MKKEHVKVIRKIAFVIAVIIFAIVTIVLFPLFKNIATKEGRLVAKELLGNAGIFRWSIFNNA